MPDPTPAPTPVPHPDVRFSLANERTLLAYQRTAVGLLAAAVAVAHFVVGGIAVVLAIVLTVTAVVAIAGGYRQYVANDRAIWAGDPAPRGATAHLVSIGLVVCAVVVVVYLLTPSR